MDYRIIEINIKMEETIVIPAAVVTVENPYVVFKVMTSASDPKPRTFVLRRTGDNGLALIEKD